MPKITSQKVKRIHLSFLENDYQQISQLAKDNKTSISEIIRTCVKLLCESQKPNMIFEKDLEENLPNANRSSHIANNSPHVAKTLNLEF